MVDATKFGTSNNLDKFALLLCLVNILLTSPGSCDEISPGLATPDPSDSPDNIPQHIVDRDTPNDREEHVVETSPVVDSGNIMEEKSHENGDTLNDPESVKVGHTDETDDRKHAEKNTDFITFLWSYMNNIAELLVAEFSSSIDGREETEVSEEVSTASTNEEESKEDTVQLSMVEPEISIADQNVVDEKNINMDKPDNEKDIKAVEDLYLNIENSNVSADVNSSFVNNTQLHPVNETDSKKFKFHCIAKNVSENDTASVKIVNGSTLLSMLRMGQNSSVDGVCAMVLFFAPWCPFCARLAPHYNALGRAYLHLDILAVNTMDFSYLNVKFGTVAVPHIILFRNSRPVMRFNNTERSFDTLISFITKMTGLEPNSSVNITEMDYFGPLSSMPIKQTDYLLILAWVFVIMSTFYVVTVSHVGQRMINQVRILWHEHQHID